MIVYLTGFKNVFLKNIYSDDFNWYYDYIFEFSRITMKRNNIFIWRIIALQYYVSFCHNQRESAIGWHMSPPSWTLLPPPTPFHPSRLSQSTGFEKLDNSSIFSALLTTFFIIRFSIHFVMCNFYECQHLKNTDKFIFWS